MQGSFSFFARKKALIFREITAFSHTNISSIFLRFILFSCLYIRFIGLITIISSAIVIFRTFSFFRFSSGTRRGILNARKIPFPGRV
jgi:hypothetical protein